MIREVFSGVFLERKFGENFYFAHRSFLEFFVAKVLLERSTHHNFSMETINSAINIEIIDLMRWSGRDHGFFLYAFHRMQTHSGELKLELLKQMYRCVTAHDKNSKLQTPLQHHIYMAFKAIPLYDTFNESQLADCLSGLVQDLVSETDERPRDALYFLLDALFNSLSNVTVAKHIKDVARFLVTKVDYRKLRNRKENERLIGHNFFGDLLFKCGEYAERTAPSDKKGSTKRVIPSLKLNLRKLLEEMDEDRPRITISHDRFPSNSATEEYTVAFTELDILLESESDALEEAFKAKSLTLPTK